MCFIFIELLWSTLKWQYYIDFFFLLLFTVFVENLQYEAHRYISYFGYLL